MLTGLRHHTTCPKLGPDIPPTAENEMTSTIQFLGGKPIDQVGTMRGLMGLCDYVDAWRARV